MKRRKWAHERAVVDGDPVADAVSSVLARLIKDSHVLAMAGFVQHGSVSTLQHTVSVAYMAAMLAHRSRKAVDIDSVIIGALLHDYYLYDWHVKTKVGGRWHAFKHGRYALENAEHDCPHLLTRRSRDAITAHMFPLARFPRTREGRIVSVADKMVSTAEAAGLPWLADVADSIIEGSGATPCDIGREVTMLESAGFPER